MNQKRPFEFNIIISNGRLSFASWLGKMLLGETAVPHQQNKQYSLLNLHQRQFQHE